MLDGIFSAPHDLAGQPPVCKGVVAVSLAWLPQRSLRRERVDHGRPGDDVLQAQRLLDSGKT